MFTIRRDDFKLISAYQNNHVCFSTIEDLKYLCNGDKVLVGGHILYQIFLWVLQSVLLPEWYSYLFWTDKTPAPYEAAFRHIMEKCRLLEITYSLNKIVVDFEQVIYKAAENVWWKIASRFCITRTWWRKIQRLSQENANEQSEIDNWLKWISGLPFLNSNQIQDTFVKEFVSWIP